MLRKTAWLLAALLLFAAANVRLRWDCEVAGETLALGCSARAAQRAAEAARAAAEEILLPSREAAELTDALLRATPGIALREDVYLGGQRVGAVTDAAAFRQKLRGYIDNTVPDWAWGGVLSKPLRVERRWGRTGYASAPGDMVLLVTGIAPVFYYDAEGNYATA